MVGVTHIVNITLFILMDFPRHIDTLFKDLSILYLKGTHWNFKILFTVFYLSK